MWAIKVIKHIIVFVFVITLLVIQVGQRETPHGRCQGHGWQHRFGKPLIVRKGRNVLGTICKEASTRKFFDNIVDTFKEKTKSSELDRLSCLAVTKGLSVFRCLYFVIIWTFLSHVGWVEQDKTKWGVCRSQTCEQNCVLTCCLCLFYISATFHWISFTQGFIELQVAWRERRPRREESSVGHGKWAIRLPPWGNVGVKDEWRVCLREDAGTHPRSRFDHLPVEN